MLVCNFRFKPIHIPFVFTFSGSWIEAPALSKLFFYTCTGDCTSLLRPVAIYLKEGLFKVKIADEKWITQESVSAYFKLS